MKYFIAILIVGALIVVGWLVLRSGSTQPTPTPTSTPTPTPTPVKTPTPTPTPGLIVNESTVYRVAIQNFAFSPASLTVKRGDVVIFTNGDPTQHTVTADGGAFNSGFISSGAQWTLTTANLAPGAYPFHCSIHTTMHGTITIQ